MIVENKTISDEALSYFQNGYYCSEAILKAFNDRLNLGLSEDVLKIATGFGTGFGLAKCSCGAVTGAVLVLSFLYGRSTPEVSEKPAFDAVRELHDRFKDEFGVICCRSLTKRVEWGTKEHHKHCEQFVVRAVDIAQEIIQKH